MFKNIGKCSCGQTKVVISLPQPLAQYSPRKCDCDFCMARNVAYLSDPDGELAIESLLPFDSFDIVQQGSNQASFIICTGCKFVIAGVIELEDKLMGALNATLLSNVSQLQQPTLVSPQKLAAQDKLARWKSLWLLITINGLNHL